MEFSIDSLPKYLSITNSGEQGLNWQALIQYVTPSVDGWLSIFPNSGQLSASETKKAKVSQYLAGFPEGEYQAKIIVDAGQIEGSPKEIEVLLKVADDTPPRVSFNPFSSIQREPIFTLSWQGEDVVPVTPIQDGISFVSPSGIDGFLLVYTSTPVLDGVTVGLNGLQYFDFSLNQWKAWLEDKTLFIRDTFLKLLGKDGWTYFFQIKAQDKAGNQSEEWVESNAVEISLPKPILKVEPQSLKFEGIESGSNPELKTFTISNIGDAPLEWEIEIYPEVSWLSLSSVFGQLVSKNDEEISVSADVSVLSFGQYVIDLLITSNGGSEQIEVILELEKDNVPPIAEDGGSRKVVINEIAWMGTEANWRDEWIELYNNTANTIYLSGWTLKAKDGIPKIELSGKISSQGFFLLERTDNKATSEEADWCGSFGTGGLRNNPNCEVLSLFDQNDNLIDETVCLDNGNWPAGKNEKKEGKWIRASMERINPILSGADSKNWASNNLINRNGLDVAGNPINGTPRHINSRYQH
ncbi:MAG: hypothetical protein DDT42_02030 [candidate division WS2 bacterium]|uniref:LTD domain-containing protein n=1 Tax=Psychracetigena formicireducens TaxID=2986056 RepID=A0A9E2BIG6_PSYF1|nr:hypothetical protein [Candidatus Psychracetigena formicireducens]